MRPHLYVFIDPAATVASGPASELAALVYDLSGMRLRVDQEPITGTELQARLADALGTPPTTFPSLRGDAATEPIVSTRTDDGPSLAVNVIVRDGLSRGSDIIRSLRSVAPVATEIVVLDTGSTDNTLEALEELRPLLPCPLRVDRTFWVDDFAVARNTALSLTSPGVEAMLWIDADEEYSIEACRWIVGALALDAVEMRNGQPVGYRLPLVGPGIPLDVHQLRVASMIEGLQWRHELHEELDESLVALGGRINRLADECQIYHHSYTDPDHARANSERDAQVIQAHPDKPGLNLRGHHAAPETVIVQVSLDGRISVEVAATPQGYPTGLIPQMEIDQLLSLAGTRPAGLLDGVDLKMGLDGGPATVREID